MKRLKKLDGLRIHDTVLVKDGLNEFYATVHSLLRDGVMVRARRSDRDGTLVPVYEKNLLEYEVWIDE